MSDDRDAVEHRSWHTFPIGLRASLHKSCTALSEVFKRLRRRHTQLVSSRKPTNAYSKLSSQEARDPGLHLDDKVSNVHFPGFCLSVECFPLNEVVLDEPLYILQGYMVWLKQSREGPTKGSAPHIPTFQSCMRATPAVAIHSFMSPLYLELLPVGTVESLFQTQSPELSLHRPARPAPDKGPLHDAPSKSLGQFVSHILEEGPCAGPSSGEQLRFNADVLLHAGGLVWACDFCPWAISSSSSSSSASARQPASEQRDLLAAAVHPSNVKRNKAGQLLQGIGAVQVWIVPNTKRVQGCPDGAPRLAMCIIHDGCVTWDVKWCPEPSLVRVSPTALPQSTAPVGGPPDTAAAQKPGSKRPRADSKGASASKQQPAGEALLTSSGILAFVSGDARVQIVSMPEPSELSGGERAQPGSSASSSSCGAASPVPAVRLPCQHLITQEMLGGSVPCSLEWQRSTRSRALQQPARPEGDEGIKLLVGCCDGAVSGWRLPCTAMQQLQGLFHIR